MKYVIGVDLGGTQLRAALVSHDGRVVEEIRERTAADEGPHAVIEQIIGCIAQIRTCVPAQAHLLGVGLGVPGPVDPEQGVVFTTPNMVGWKDVPLRSILEERTQLRIELGNDANAAALGEWYFGGGVGCQHMVYLTISTGIGGGVIMDGHLLLGYQGAGAELGHILIDSLHYKTWEMVASGTALGATAAAMMPTYPDSLLHTLTTVEAVTAAHVSQAFAAGDRCASLLMQREAEFLGMGFVSILHLFSPEVILVGGSVVTANPFLLDEARAVVQQHVIADIYRTIPIRVAPLGAQVGILGAAALMLQTQAQKR